MSKYEHGDWFCRPANEAEALEIIARAVASGAVQDETFSDWSWNAYGAWGVCNGRTHTQTVVFYRQRSFTAYSIKQVREKFPLSGEKDNAGWISEGLPPVGAQCEYSCVGGSYKACTFVGINSRKSLVIENESGELLEFHDHQIKFRPLRSERERWIDDAALVLQENSNGHISYKMMAERFHDALKTGQLKAPEVL